MSTEHDDDATVPITAGRRTPAEFEELTLGVGERGELVVAPETLMCRPVLTIQTSGGEVSVEDVYSGATALTSRGSWPASCMRDGVQLDVSVSREVPLKIVVFNSGPVPAVVGASLVSGAKEKS